MAKKASKKIFRILSLLTIVVGLIIVIGGYLSYSGRVCNCPAQPVRQPVVPCCLDTPIVNFIYGGLILVVVGSIAYLYFRVKF